MIAYPQDRNSSVARRLPGFRSHFDPADEQPVQCGGRLCVCSYLYSASGRRTYSSFSWQPGISVACDPLQPFLLGPVEGLDIADFCMPADFFYLDDACDAVCD